MVSLLVDTKNSLDMEALETTVTVHFCLADRGSCQPCHGRTAGRTRSITDGTRLKAGRWANGVRKGQLTVPFRCHSRLLVVDSTRPSRAGHQRARRRIICSFAVCQKQANEEKGIILFIAITRPSAYHKSLKLIVIQTYVVLT